MKNIKLFTLGIAGLLALGSCNDFGDINVDPNNPSIPETRFLFTDACLNVHTFSLNGTYNPWTQMFPQYIAERQNVQYGLFAMQDFGTGSYYYEYLQNLKMIIDLNSDEATAGSLNVNQMGSSENQIAAARTLSAYYYMHMTDILGMIPYTEALKGTEGNFAPKYDSQESIYADLDKELTEAYAQFDENATLNSTYDILYNGDIAKWKKMNASLRMMMAIKLSDVDPATGKERFARAYADGGIVDNEDCLERKFLPEVANQNPMYDNVIISGRKDFAPSELIINKLKEYNDPRLSAYATPNSEGEYIGIPLGIYQADVLNYKDISAFDPRFYQQDAPMVVISASHILLIEAEAAVRGWIGGSAEDFYKKGIKASMDFYGVDGFDTYYAQESVKLSGSADQQIEKIGMQRWFANYMQNGVEAWSDWRRLNVPKMYPGPASIEKHIPYRRIYNTDDYKTNVENYNAAIAAQGEDSFETRVWWDVKDND